MPDEIAKHIKKINKASDKTGRRYGKLVCLERLVIGNIKRKNIWYRCKCDCGNEVTVNSEHLKNGGTNKKSCGCDNKRKKLRNDIAGQKFGMLTVLENHRVVRVDKNGKNVFEVAWKCRCDCGKIRESVRSHGLRNSSIYSCGCTVRNPPPPIEDRQEALIRRCYAEYPQWAARKKFGRNPNLTIEQYSKLCLMDCFYCGRPPSNTKLDFKRGKKVSDTVLKYSGLDKIGPSGTYDLDNVVPCCIVCNRAKESGSTEEFVEYLKQLRNNEQLCNP